MPSPCKLLLLGLDAATWRVIDPLLQAGKLPHLERLYRLAVRLTGQAHDAEDMVQETYIKALKAYPSLRDPARMWPWLSRILTRVVLDRHRRQPRGRRGGERSRRPLSCW